MITNDALTRKEAEFVRLFSDRLHLKTQYCPLCFTRLCYCFCLHGSEASIVFRGFAFLAASIQLRGKKFLRLVLLVSLNLLYLNTFLSVA